MTITVSYEIGKERKSVTNSRNAHLKPICKKGEYWIIQFESRGFFESHVLVHTHFPISNHCQSVKHWSEIYWWWKYDKYQQISLQFSAATHNFRAVSEHWPWYVQVEFQSQLHSCQGLYNLSHLWKKAFRVEPWFFTAKYHSFVFLL